VVLGAGNHRMLPLRTVRICAGGQSAMVVPTATTEGGREPVLAPSVPNGRYQLLEQESLYRCRCYSLPIGVVASRTVTACQPQNAISGGGSLEGNVQRHGQRVAGIHRR